MMILRHNRRRRCDLTRVPEPELRLFAYVGRRPVPQLFAFANRRHALALPAELCMLFGLPQQQARE
jgi:hypothetical protein